MNQQGKNQMCKHEHPQKHFQVSICSCLSAVRSDVQAQTCSVPEGLEEAQSGMTKLYLLTSGL